MSEQDQHSSFIKTPRQLVIVVLLSFLVPVFGIVMLVHLVVGRPQADPAAMRPEAVAARIQPVGRTEFGAGAGGTARAPRSGADVFKAACAACHETGAAGAPKIGDQAAWAKPLKLGLDQLVENAIRGVRAMPPRGGNPDLSDLEVARAVVFIGNRSGGKLKEPAEPAAEAKK